MDGDAEAGGQSVQFAMDKTTTRIILLMEEVWPYLTGLTDSARPSSWSCWRWPGRRWRRVRGRSCSAAPSIPSQTHRDEPWSKTKSPTRSPAVFMAWALTPACPGLMSSTVMSGTNFYRKWLASERQNTDLFLFSNKFKSECEFS